jgi:tRNA G46 methylase TrmB
VKLAKLFPKTIVHGIDIDEASIDGAKKLIEQEKLQVRQ